MRIKTQTRKGETMSIRHDEQGDLLLADAAKGGACDALTAAVADCSRLGSRYGYSDRETICSACDGNARDACDLVADAGLIAGDEESEHLRLCANAVRERFPAGMEA